MIPRVLTAELLAQLGEYSIVTVIGRRQSGKTTLVGATLPDYQYVSLEDPESRQIATEEPKAFLKRYSGKAIFDEIQRTPELLSYLQGIVDERPGNRQYVLTGSHQLEMRAAITQLLAGRTGLLHLLPFSIAELDGASIRFERFEDSIHRRLPAARLLPAATPSHRLRQLLPDPCRTRGPSAHPDQGRWSV